MKNQLKKSLSLFLAVIMLLSCWVWVAPQKASAVATPYYLKFVANVTDTGDEDSSVIKVSYKDNNGQGTQTSDKQVASYSKRGLDGNDQVIWEGTVDGWPTSISLTMKLGACRSERYENFRLYVGSSAETCNTNILTSDNYTFSGNAFSAKTSTFTGKISGTAPKFTEITTMSATDVNVTKLPNGASATSTVKVTGGKDQYGVDWKASIPTSGFSYSLKKDESTALASTYGTISGSSNSTTATIYDDVQTLFSNAANGKIYAYATYNSKTKSVPINLTFPTYDITFDANGGKIGATDSDAKDQVVVSGIKYGGVIGKSPAHRAKAGFDFKGFYSVQNSDATGLDASFSGTLYKDSETSVDTIGDCTWYAAWQVLPITATFMTADNQLIGTVEGRYNNNLTASNMYNGDDGLNAAVKASHTAGKVKFDGNVPVYTDGNQAYTFAGWKIIEAYDESVIDGNEDTVLKGDVTFQAVYTKANATKYTVSFEDGAGKVTSTKDDYFYRDAVIGVPSSATKATDDKYSYEFIGWAKKLGDVKFFAVDENDCGEDGVKLSYTSKDAAQFIVKGDATYVPVFRMIVREYDVTFIYTVDGGTTETEIVGGYHLDDTPVMPEGIKDNYTAGGLRYPLNGWFVGEDTNTAKQLDEIVIKGNTTLTATYGAGQGAEYTINFYGKADDGVTDVLLDKGTYTHNSDVTAPEVLQTIDTEDSLYTFAGWSPEFTSTATADVDYYATYTKKDYADVYFYNYDGTLIYSLDGKTNGFFAGETIIPAYEYIIDGEKVLPTKEEDPVGTYKFTGWADGNGNEVVPGTDKFEGDTKLYAQFETEYKNYTVKFLNDDGTVVSEKTYHYATEIEIPANPKKEADKEYKYDFRAWSPDVSEVCYGDATYTATYRREKQYYTVTWLNDAKAVISESNYQYDAKIQQAVINEPVNYPAATTGKTWALAYWALCNANGEPVDAEGNVVSEENIVKFARGQKMPAEHIYFYPVFEEVDNVIKVEYYKEDGKTLIGTAMVPYGESIKDYGEDFAKKVRKDANETHHYTVKWVGMNGAEVTEDTIATEDISVKVEYIEEEHSPEFYETVVEPTCNVQGYDNYKCAVDECDMIFYNWVVPPVEDTAAPTGQINVGGTIWTLDAYNEGIDYTDIKFVNPNTFLVVNAEDLGSEGDLYRGVGKIEYVVSQDKVNPADLDGWKTVYDYEEFRTAALNAVLEEKNITLLEYNGYNHGTDVDRMKKADIDRTVDAMLSIYKANATGVVSNLNFENGKEYIVYIRVSDRAGNGEVNTCYFSSGKLSYGSNAAEITVSGDGYGSKFCEKANIRITDDADGVTVYLDGAEVDAYTNPGTTAANGTFVATFETAEKGTHTVTVIDKHGNITTKIFEIKGSHSYRNYIIGATCEKDGSSYDICTVCGVKANEDVITALGHNFSENYIDKAATCTADGSRTYVCFNNCGKKLVLKPTDDAATIAQAKKENAEGEWVALTAEDLKHLKATGVHTYEKVKNKDGSDGIEDAWVIDAEATCVDTGSKYKDCTECGERVIEEIPADDVNGHKFYRETVTLKPTCTTDGQKTKTCRYCGDVVETGVVEKLGHIGETYDVVNEPNCTDDGSKQLRCDRCDEHFGDLVKVPALGHAWIIDGDPYKKEDKWYQDYKCNRAGCTATKTEVTEHEEQLPAEVKFVNGAEAEELNTQVVETVVGAYINAGDVTAPTKAADATYKYTFSHWADAKGNEAKFPIKVDADATYYAVYTEKYINYTITYKAEDGVTEIGKTGYLHNGTKVDLAKGPAKAATKYLTYEFAGWVLLNDSSKVYTEYTINGADVSLKPTYTAKTRDYAVTYAYDVNNIIETFLVEAGTAARPCYEIPTKASDSVYHYTFKEWDKKNELSAVTSNIYATPVFTATEHTMGDIVITEATCTENQVKLYACKVDGCGFSYTVEVENTAGHVWKELEDGSFECERCDEKLESIGEEFNITYYNALGKIYTHSYNVPQDTAINKVLPTAPVKAADKMYTYTFNGWATKDAEGNLELLDESATVTADLKLYPSYKATRRTYTVIYAYNIDNIIGSVSALAGKPAPMPTEAPEKASDSKYHYTFSGWNKSAELVAVYSDIYTIPVFTHEAHDFAEAIKEAATCTTDKEVTYTCNDCKYSYDKVIANSALGHDWNDPVFDEETGKYISTCKNCDAETENTKTYTVKFFVNESDANPIKTVSYIPWNTTIDGARLPAAPTKESTATADYTFAGWAVKGDETKTIVDVANLVIGKDYEFVAVFEEIIKEYTVVFAYDAKNVIETYTKVKAGSSITFEGETPVKACDSNYHYTFSGWKGYEANELDITIEDIQSDLYIVADFAKTKHAYNKETLSEATCTSAKGIRNWCDCNGNGEFNDKVEGAYVDYYYDIASGSTAPHDYEEVKKENPANGQDGYIKSKCKVCGNEKTEILKWQDPDANKVTIKITVKDSNNNNSPVEGAKVDIYSGSNYVATGYTNVYGEVEFTLEKGDYRAIVTMKNADNTEFTFKAEKNGEINNAPSIAIRQCGCACHRENLWGSIFRFFHKIIKMIAGEFKCCADPSHLYG